MRRAERSAAGVEHDCKRPCWAVPRQRHASRLFPRGCWQKHEAILSIPNEGLQPTLPVRSCSARAGKFLLPGWWGKAVLTLVALCFSAAMNLTSRLPVWLTHDLPQGISRLLPPSLEVDHISQGVIFAVCVMLFELLLIVLVGHMRFNRFVETVVHADRIEMRQDSEKEQIVHWHDILRQDARNDDIWLEQQGSGKSAFNMIRFDVPEGGIRQAVRLFCHLNPIGRTAPTYSNLRELRHAFLLSLLRAQPSLRVQESIYALCEIDPVSLRPSSIRKWVGRLNLSVAVALALMSLAVILANADNSAGWLLIAKMFGAVTVTSLVAWMTGTWLLSILFIAPEDKRAVAARARMLGAGIGSMRSTRDYPLADDSNTQIGMRKTPLGMEWAEALIARRRPDEECPWQVLEGWDWSRLLAERPELADRCSWDKLDGEEWSYLLSEQPSLAGYCPWEKLAPCDWATLLASQPQFLDVGKVRFQWADLEGGDWSELLSTQPQFSEFCNYSKLSGMDWAFLLREQPQFAVRCSWEKLEEDDWTILLRAQPQFESLRSTKRRVFSRASLSSNRRS